MNKLLSAIVASTFVFGSVSVFAADTAKKEELTREQRVEMRSRAEQLTLNRAQAPTQVKAVTPKAKPHQVKKAKKVSRHDVKKTRPHA